MKRTSKTKHYRQVPVGKMANFLLPSLKLKMICSKKGESIEVKIHHFLIKNFGGYTVTAANIFGYWQGPRNEIDYGEHKEYKVALGKKEEDLKNFLGELAVEMDEDCIYLEAGDETFFIYPRDL